MTSKLISVFALSLLATVALAQSYVPRIGGGGASTCISGVFYSAALTANTGNLILLNGQPKATSPTGSLSPEQVARATALGFGANMTNATGRVLVQGTLLASLGSNLIAQNQLPNINLSHNHGVGVGIAGSSDVFLNGSSGNPRGAVTDAANVHLNGNVTQQVFTPLALGVNHFICL